ncbi:MAG: hypothetical protein QOE14_288 [Humisphaera sp.]|nr:hypothetical protein [Humisphaera sp.]
MTDGELLQRYAANRDGEAFAEIVRRHGGMVHATARRLARDEAEDVTQAVFLLLAQKAGKLVRYRNLAGWLYNVARYCASNAQRMHGRRKRHLENYQQQESVVKQSAISTDPHAMASELLDAGLTQLKDDQRQAVLLRYIEGLTLDEAAERLGVNTAAVAKRAERGVTRLRQYFAARGVTLSDAALAATPITTTLAASLSQLATGAAPAKGAVTIASATGTTMTLATVKAAAVVLLAVAGVTAAAVGVAKVARPTPNSSQASTQPATQSMAAIPPPAAGLTQDTGRAVATQFTRALRDRDEEAVAKLLIANSPDEARAAAAGFIAQIRDGMYAAFPNRLDQVVNSMFMSSQQGEMIYATLDTSTPTEADVQRLSIRLEPVAGQWRVRDAKISDADAMRESSPKAPPATAPLDPNVQAGTYTKAAEIFQQFQSRMNYEADPAALEKQKPLVLENLKLAQDDLKKLADALRSTDLTIPDQNVIDVNKWLEEARRVLDQQGADAFFEFGNGVRNDQAFIAASKKIWGLSETLPARAEAESERLHAGTRPPSFAPPIELTLSWDNSLHSIPGPVTVPQWFRDSPTFKVWQKRHDVRRFRTRDDAGNVYEIQCSGGMKGEDGRTYEVIPHISMFRPDGTLAAAAEYDHFGRAVGWGTFDKTGKVFVTKVVTERSGSATDAPAKVAQVIFFDEKKNQRMWEVEKDNVVSMELSKDPIGGSVKTLRGGRKPRAHATTRAI